MIALDLGPEPTTPASASARARGESTTQPFFERAPLWRRSTAWAVDSALVLAAAAPPLVAAGYGSPGASSAFDALALPGAGFVAVLAFTYAVLAKALLGETVGKKLLGLRVAGLDGAAPTLARSAGRAALAVLGCVPLGAGVLAALFTQGGRGLHDLATGTAVVVDGAAAP